MKKKLTPAELNTISTQIQTEYKTSIVQHISTLEDPEVKEYSLPDGSTVNVGLKIIRNSLNSRKKSIFFKVM